MYQTRSTPGSGIRISHPKYRPDIDGLRAVAVLGVLAYHAFPKAVPGGFVGVDIFFVISGFLISGKIWSGLERGNFSFAGFFGARIRRIFPGLAVVLAACYAIGWFTLLPDEFKQLGKHMGAGAGFVSNLVLAAESGYFDNAAETKPLLHLWSLGVEEQFYIAWPLLLWGAWALWKRAFGQAALVACLAAASFFFGVRDAQAGLPAAFFSPLTRFWELLAGAFLAWNAQFGAQGARGKVLAQVLSIGGLLLVGMALAFVSRDVPFPGWLALLPVLGAAMVIAAGPTGWANRVLLASPAAVWVGLISYPLYLWHWPLLAFPRIFEGETPAVGIRIGALVLAVGLAWLTTRFIERPLRFGARRNANTAGLALAMLALGVIGWATYRADGFAFRMPSLESITRASGEWEYPGAMRREEFRGRPLYLQPSGRSRTTLFVGDSNIEQYAPRVAELARNDAQHTNSAEFLTLGACLPIPGVPHDFAHQNCVGLMDDALEMAATRKEIDTVVVGGLWAQYLVRGTAMKGRFGPGTPAYRDALERLGTYVRALAGTGKAVYIVLNVPVGAEFDPRSLVDRRLRNFPALTHRGGLPYAELQRRYGAMQQDITAVARAAGATVINPEDSLCAGGWCASTDAAGEPIYKDAGHLRPGYVREHVHYLDETVRPR